jgi:hypothetical protein
MKKIFIFLFIITLMVLAIAGCQNDESITVDYSDSSNWLAIPENVDAHGTDVFFVYPTIYQGDGVQDITDPEQIEEAKVTLRTQASVFEDSANIYAPLYRQVGRDGFNDVDNLNDYLAIGEEDVKNALIYYLENYNNGKPFIIAGHSQGSSTLISLLTKIWGSTGAEDRMIATYIIGFSVTDHDIELNKNIRMSSGPRDIGCFIAYNSIKDGVQDESVQILDGAIVTNPLSWISTKDDGEYIDASQNLGAVFFDENGYEPMKYDNFTSAQVKDGGLVCEVVNTSILSDYPIEGIYHRDDYSLFYENIKKNVAERIEQYFLMKNN